VSLCFGVLGNLSIFRSTLRSGRCYKFDNDVACDKMLMVVFQVFLILYTNVAQNNHYNKEILWGYVEYVNVQILLGSYTPDRTVQTGVLLCSDVLWMGKCCHHLSCSITKPMVFRIIKISLSFLRYCKYCSYHVNKITTLSILKKIHKIIRTASLTEYQTTMTFQSQ
jgi:hypothetical protein